MIRKLDATDLSVAEKIKAVFQVSYAVEADLLNAIDFPPLQRTLVNFLKSDSIFYGYYKANVIAGVIEVKRLTNHVHIQSLVVDPYYFRQGIASELLNYTIARCVSSTITVETGLKNYPAIALYEKFGFIETKQWDTDHGVRKISFEKHQIT